MSFDISQFELKGPNPNRISDPNAARSALGASQQLRTSQFMLQGNSWNTPSGIGTTASTPEIGTGEDTLNDIGGAAEAVVGSTIASGQDIGTAISAPIVQAGLNQISTADQQGLSTIFQLRKKAADAGQDTTHFDNLIKNWQTSKGQTISDIFPALKKSNEQVIGDFAGMAMDVIGGADIAKAGYEAAAGTAEKTVGKGFFSRLLSGAKTGAKYGAGYGAAGGLQSNQNALGVAESTGVGAATGAVTGAVAEGALGARPPQTAEDAAHATEDVLNKKGRISALESAGRTGGAERTGALGTVEPSLTPADIQRGKTVLPYLDKDPVKTLSNINGEITHYSESTIQPYLDKNPRAFNQKTFASAIDKVEPKFTYEGDPQSKVYDAVKQRAQAISAEFKGNTADSWNARKAFYDWAKSAKANVFANDTGAFNQAVRDVGGSWNKFIADQIGDKTFTDQMSRLTDLFDARSNVASANNQIVGESRIGTAFRKNPALKHIVKSATGAVVGGAAGNLIGGQGGEALGAGAGAVAGGL